MNIREVSGYSPTLVDLRNISKAPGAYTMSFGFDLAPLARSIEEIGLLHPPFVTRNVEGDMEIVSGYRRVRAMEALQRERIPCIDLSGSGLTSPDLLLFNLHENLGMRKFNDIEKGMILNRLIPHFPRELLLKKFMPLLDLPSRGAALDLYASLEKFDDGMKVTLTEGTLSMRSVRSVSELDHASRDAILSLIRNIKFNFNQQIQFIENLVDLSIIEERSIVSLLGEEPILRVTEDPKINNPQKARKVLDILKSRRLPFLARAERRFKERIADLDLPVGVKIAHSPFFEAPDYRLEIPFRNPADLKNKLGALSRLRGLDAFRDPWEDDPR